MGAVLPLALTYEGWSPKNKKRPYPHLEWRIKFDNGITTDASYEVLADHLSQKGLDGVKSIKRLK